jgi:hypothetical protein
MDIIMADLTQEEPLMSETGEAERRYLVLVVGMLAGPGPGRRLYDLSNAQPSRFHVVVPPTRPDYGLTWTERQAHDDANQRLDIILDFTKQMGMNVSGEVSESDDPVEAVRAIGSDFDELIVIDNPHGFARWQARKGLAELRTDPGWPLLHLSANPPIVQSKHFDLDRLKNEFARFLADLKREEATPSP